MRKLQKFGRKPCAVGGSDLRLKSGMLVMGLPPGRVESRVYTKVLGSDRFAMSEHAKPWAGRFNAPTDAFVEAFTASVGFDQRLYRYDIQGSIAHATMLARQGILTEADRDAIVAGLEAVRARIDAGDLRLVDPAGRRPHERRDGPDRRPSATPARSLHTGRSRNDQVATDVRLWLRDEIDQIRAGIERLQSALLDLAEREADTIMPGFTHLQVAQPITFGHHMMAWFEMLERDRERLADCRRRVNVMPLGAAALAGTTYPIDRHYTAELLGFDRPAENSLDAVSDRDFAIEFAACAAILMMHLSRFSEELILWSSAQFGFVDLSDSLLYRLLDHAAEEEPGRARTGARQERADLRPSDRAC